MKSFQKGICFLMLAFSLLFDMEVKAQPTGDPVGDPDATSAEMVPIDSGLYFLLGVGLAYGIKKIFALKQRIKNPTG